MKHRAKLMTVVAALALLGTACSTTGGGAASSAPAAGSSVTMQDATLLIGGVCKIIYLPAELATQLGYYKDAGLNIKIISEPANGGSVVDAVLTGEVAASVSFYDHSVDLLGLGKNVEAVAVMDKVPGEVVLVHSTEAATVKTAADFSGLNLGVTSLSGSGAFLMRYLVQRAGLSQDSFTLVKGSVGDAFIGGMTHNSFDVGMTTDPTATQAIRSGLGDVIYDMRTEAGTTAALGGIYPAGSLYSASSYIAAHPDIIQKLTTAVVRTLQWIHGHTAQQIADKMPADCQGSDPSLYVQAIQGNLPMFTTDGIMPTGGPDNVLRVLQAFDTNVQGKTLDLSKTYTDQFAQAAASK